MVNDKEKVLEYQTDNGHYYDTGQLVDKYQCPMHG